MLGLLVSPMSSIHLITRKRLPDSSGYPVPSLKIDYEQKLLFRTCLLNANEQQEG